MARMAHRRVAVVILGREVGRGRSVATLLSGTKFLVHPQHEVQVAVLASAVERL